MSIYVDAEQLYTVLRRGFDKVKERPGAIETFTSSNLVIRLRLTDPDAEVLLDGRQPPLEIFFGARPGKADLELTMTADLLHEVWSGQRKLKDAFFGGQIQSSGNIFLAMKLTDLFREAERAYMLIQRNGSASDGTHSEGEDPSS
ncbi:MAG: SCP2 sterol-binding domain-containing protein [Caldilineaceae bacterium]|nr:SCP2 sterol-binding domain-containing protein [Caldilineaceae bacterium]